MSSYTFAIVGKQDNPLYELVQSQKKEGPQAHQENQFFLHAALDIVDEELWKTNSMFLKVVDKFNDRCISAFVTATNIKLLLLHDGNKGDDAIKSFFAEVHELYLKVMLNPFFDPNVAISSVVILPPCVHEGEFGLRNRMTVSSLWAEAFDRAERPSLLQTFDTRVRAVARKLL